MTSQLFWSFLVLALVTEASSWATTRRRSSSCRIRNCAVSRWGSWNACSQPCGTGAIQARARTVTRTSSCGGLPCPNLVEIRSCNQGKCANGGTPNIVGCNCRQKFSGDCCTQTEVYKTIGCYNDTLDRAIPTLEGTDDILDGHYSTRSDPIYKCYEVAKKLGFKVFALQHSGWCASSSTAEKTFNKYGMSSNCENDGEGGPNANQVYYIKDYTGVGCYKDTVDRAIPTLEDTDSVLDGGAFFYQRRQNAIVKCAVAARKRGFPAFALQDGGWCAASSEALETFNKYGYSSDCQNDGRGGPFANNVYVFQDEDNTVTVPDPIAFYPLNSKYSTQEIKNRQPQGTPVGVSIAAGPDGKDGGSYQFTGQKDSYIEFPNNGGLDVLHSITIICWMYPENTDGPIFNYKITGSPWAVHFWVHSGKLYGVISQRNYEMLPGLITFHALALNQWHYVGFTYSHITGMANLWLDDQRQVQRNIGADLSISTQHNVRMGALVNDGRYFKGRITAMQIYDVALTEEQINAVENAGQGNDRCYEMSWESALSGPGWANCSLGRYISGVWRKTDAVISSTDGIDNIKKGQCCSPPHEYKDDTPVCQTLDWKTSVSKNDKWASCPDGYFLQGIYRSNGTWLHNIEKALCCRPRNFKNMTKDCYDEDVRKSLNKKGWSKCQDWHYMMGVYKGDCDQLNCIDMVKCCRMPPPDKVVLSYWLLNGHDEDISLIGSPPFTEGRCPGSKALFLNQSHSYALAPIITLNDRSFTISCWIKQTKWVPDEIGAIYGDWYNPRQFLLSIKNQKITFQRYQYENDELELWSIETTNVTLDTWTHVAVTWDHIIGFVVIYADGKVKGARLYPRSSTFVQPTGWRYQIGKDGHWNGHHFHGSVMDLIVFGTALSLDQINKLRGVPTIVNKTSVVPGGTVVVAWEPPFEDSCLVVNYTVNYRKVLSPEKKCKWRSVTVNKNTTSFTLQLNCKNEYDVAVTSLGEYWQSALNDSKIWTFKTAGDVPSPPVIINKETESLTCDMNVMWSPPADHGCPLTMYSIFHQQIQAPELGWFQTNVTNVMATNFTVTLACGKQYLIEMSAWNDLGESGRSRKWIIKTMSGSDRNTETPSSFSVFTITEKNFAITAVYQGEKGLSSPQLSGLVVGLGFLLIIICMAAFSFRQKARKNKQRARNSQPRRSKSTIIPLCHWEVLPEQVVFGEEIGRGAFGRVLKGTFRGSPGIEVFYKPRTQTVDFKEDRTVAIKVLGDTSDEGARSQFLEEIEIMKAIGSHKNIVGMLGCWVHTGPIFLMLEYVPYGDLQHWLRNKRIQKNYQKNYYSEGSRMNPDGTELHFNIDSESKALLAENEEVSRKFMNFEKLPLDGSDNKTPLPTCSRLNDETVTQKIEADELKPDVEGSAKSCEVPQNTDHDDGQQDEDVIGKDLLCFAWQIARGMNYLSSKGFVHRDLAARNVLLGEDKVVKISDFGLMRQTQESVYKLKRGKKLPVKWTAPEALYNSEYTTKSDVWSFGILLWELCTMGGNPYPGINNKELYNLLKTGYRMEKPETCSDKLSPVVPTSRPRKQFVSRLQGIGEGVYSMNNKEPYILLKTGYRMEKPDAFSVKIYQLVQSCWKEEPSERPTFKSATRSLEEMLQEDTPYLDFESLDESKAYYCNERLSDDDEGDTFL